jgi:outer membrane protein OmpA-like peptidoglycan-associated protein
MNKTIITLAAALMFGTSWTALAQEQDPTLIIPDGQSGAGQQEGQAPEQKPEKKRKKRDAEQQGESGQPSADQQFEQPQPEKKKRKKQAEQPDESMQQPSNDQQFEEPKPEKKRKKKQQAEQPVQQPVEEQAQQPEPVKKKKKKQAEQPEEPAQQQVDQPVEQPTDQQAEQPQPEKKKKKKKEQAEQPATPEQTTGESKTETPAAGNVPADVSQYLSDTRPASELSDAELSQRIKAGRSLSKMKGLPDDVRQELAGKAKQARTEAIAREQGGGKAGKQPEPGQQTTEQPTEQQPEQTTGESKPGTSDQAGVPPEVTQYLSDTRPASELSDAELAERVKAGRTLSRTKGLSDDVRQELAGKAKQARTEAMAREQGKGGKQPEPGQQPTAEQPTAEQPSGEQPVIADPKKNAEGQEVVPNDQAGQPPITLDKKDVEKLDSNKSTPQAEAKAKAYLDDNRRADQLKDDEAKARLDGMRELLSDNELSRDTKRELRRRLKEERDLYRNRVAEKVIVEERKDEERDRFPRRRDREQDRRWDNWAERDILRDRRRSDELEEGELRRRIEIYRVVIYDDRYSDDERAYWRDMMDRDRRYLGDYWLRRDRDERERYWRDRRDRNDIRIDININLSGDREPPPSAFIDEIDDEELEDYLITAPRRKVPRRYTVAEIEEEPEIRTAMPAIEIDNIHFGFNEAFMREEEVENLDRIAEVVEKILAAHPDEVFMIEGHTDAVGSDAYNLKLSRERAQAVKKALTSYYAIAPRNLVTAGYGERYLKIPTAEPEEENRRVSFRRVTPLVGKAE